VSSPYQGKVPGPKLRSQVFRLVRRGRSVRRVILFAVKNCMDDDNGTKKNADLLLGRRV